MRIGLGIPNTLKRLSAPGPIPGPWLSDVLALPSPVAGGAGDFTTGINFTVPASKVCAGIQAEWSSSNGSPIPIVLTLWNTTTLSPIASETVTALNGLIQTTGLFGSHTLSAGTLYGVSTYNPSYYNHYVANPFALPKVYANYSVFASYSYVFGYGANNNLNNTVCSYVEPVIT